MSPSLSTESVNGDTDLEQAPIEIYCLTQKESNGEF